MQHCSTKAVEIGGGGGGGGAGGGGCAGGGGGGGNAANGILLDILLWFCGLHIQGNKMALAL